MSRWLIRTAAMLAVGALVLSACGSGRGGSADPGSPATTAGASSSAPQFGDLASPCGPGEASAAPAQGVDASTITIGYGDDAGYQGSPGLGHEASDAVKALIDWCNEQGGINGRTVVGTYYDAKITELSNVMAEACSKVFMLVGTFWALPGSAEQTRLGCGLPIVPGVVSGADLANAPLMVSPFPQPADQFNAGPAAVVAQHHPEPVKKAAGMIADFPSIKDYVERFQRTARDVGWDWLPCDQTYPITGVADYRPYVQKLKDCGVEAVFTLDLRQSMLNILDAANQIDYHPLWMNATSVYTEDFARGNVNGNADQLYFGNAFVPLTSIPDGSANATYVRLVEGSGGDVSYGGQVSASAFLLWATAAKACGDELTRDCVMSQLKGITRWTAGGLSAPQDPGQNLVGQCTLVMKVEGTRFVQWQPSEEGQFDCDPSWAKTLQPPTTAAQTLQLGSDRVSHNILP